MARRGETQCDPFRRPAGGFVLIELVLVLILLAIITAMVVPMYGASMNGVQRRGARNQLVSILLHIQERAICESLEYRFYFNPETGAYWVERQAGAAVDEFAPPFEMINENYGQRSWLPAHYAFKEGSRLRKDDETGACYISCFPTGACDAVSFAVMDTRSKKEQFSIETLGTLGRINTKTLEE